VTAIITAYCACSICCHDQLNLTANGNHPHPSHTIAGPRNLPFGTRVSVGGNTYTVEDRTAKRFDGRFDIFMRTHKEAVRFGKREMNVTRLK
jgi:3D (Asp-Asp-Asp) domain-containing protein